MNAEIVRADEIKVGDRVRHRGNTIEVYESYSVKMQDSGREKQAIRYRHVNGEYFVTWYTNIATEVARILPEPVEVRDYWQVVETDDDGDEIPVGIGWDGPDSAVRDAEMRIVARDCCGRMHLVHLVMTILSREEVKL